LTKINRVANIVANLNAEKKHDGSISHPDPFQVVVDFLTERRRNRFILIEIQQTFQKKPAFNRRVFFCPFRRNHAGSDI
ncbi:MAG TPA: hypothetical protein PLG66_15525, partial [Calditrichia bacterium]|nr:hypothetical protein [Calditrichia bacterium]